MMIQENTALLLIDIQQGFDDPYWGEQRNNPDAELVIKALLDDWRAKSRPVIHVKHNSINESSPLHPSQSGNAFQVETAPKGNEPFFEKNVNSAFIGTNLEMHLRDNHINDLVIVGLTTDHCISTSTRMAGNLGFNVYLVADATATFERKSADGSRTISADDIHDIHLASLHDEFCQVCHSSDLL